MSDLSGEEDRSHERLDRVAWALLAAAAIGVIWALFRVDYLPTLDGPHHLFLGHVENHFDDPGAGLDAWLSRGAPFTSMGFHLVFSTLLHAFAWKRAFQGTLAILALGWGFGHVALARAIHPRRAALGLVGMASSISWAVHMGFFSFAMSIAVGLGVLAIAAGAWPWTPKRRAAIAALLLVQAVTHAFGAELTVIVLAAMAIAAADGSKARAREAGLVALMSVPVALIALTTDNPATGHTAWLSIGERLRILPRTFLPGPMWRAAPPLLVAIAGVAIAASRARKETLSRAEIALAGAAALWLVLAFTTPIDLAAWQLFAPRFLPFGCLIGAALLPLERLDARARAASTIGLAIFATASIAWASQTAVSLRAAEDEALSGLDAPIKRTGPRLVVSIDAFAAQAGSAEREIPYYAPLFNMGPLYAITQGGIPPFSFLSNPKIHPFVLSEKGKERHPPLFNPGDFLDPAITQNPASRSRMLTFLAGVGAPFEDVVIHGRREDGDLLVERGYAADFRRGGLFIGHLEGCPAKAQITTSAPAVPVIVEYGADPLPRALRRSVLAPPTGDAAAPREVRLSPPLCGPMWLRVTLDRDGSGGPTPGDAHCEGADQHGRIRVAPKDKAGLTIACRLGP